MIPWWQFFLSCTSLFLHQDHSEHTDDNITFSKNNSWRNTCSNRTPSWQQGACRKHLEKSWGTQILAWIESTLGWFVPNGQSGSLLTTRFCSWGQTSLVLPNPVLLSCNCTWVHYDKILLTPGLYYRWMWYHSITTSLKKKNRIFFFFFLWTFCLCFSLLHSIIHHIHLRRHFTLAVQPWQFPGRHWSMQRSLQVGAVRS